MRYNSKHKILFKVAPPVSWSGFFGIMYINDEYLHSREYTSDDIVEFTYTGNNYKALCKYVFK